MAGSEERFAAFVGRLAAALGHADRAGPLRAYCTGLMLPGGRKSVEPMAARLAPSRVGSAHQSLHHFVANAPWSDEAVMAVVREHVLPTIEAHGPIRAWIVDDTGIPKKGRHSVGVARQYCGQLGKQDNCQIAVSLSVATAAASLPVAYRLYLPESWTEDAARRRRAGVPEEVGFQTKPEIALDQIGHAVARGLPRGVVLADAGYGTDTDFRDGVTALGLCYAVGIQSTTTVWAPGTAPLPPRPYAGPGRPAKLLRRDAAHKPVAVKALATTLPKAKLRTVTWREGARGPLRSRFAAVRVRPAHRDIWRETPRPEEWLLLEWPAGEPAPSKFWLSTLPQDSALKDLVGLAKLRWRIERDFQELKQEVGLGHYEGRGWRGFHHHATLCIAAYGFLLSERSSLPPTEARWRPKTPRLPKGWRPRGAADPTRTAPSVVDRNAQTKAYRSPRAPTPAMPMLSATHRRPTASPEIAFMTQ